MRVTPKISLQLIASFRRAYRIIATIFFYFSISIYAYAQSNLEPGKSTGSLLSLIVNLILDDEEDGEDTGPTLPIAPPPVNSAIPPAKVQSRTQMFEYDQTTGLLVRATKDPDETQIRRDVTFSYDAWGNRTGQAISSTATGAAAVTPRSVMRNFDVRGQFILEEKNGLNHKAKLLHDSRFGLVTRIEDKNGLITQTAYDNFGNRQQEISSNNSRLNITYLYCQGIAGGFASCPTQARYLVHQNSFSSDGVTVNAPWVKQYFDTEDREVRIETQGFDGSIVVVDREFDSRGQLFRESRPYNMGTTILWTTYEYDDMQRVVRVINPDGSNNTRSYNGSSLGITNELNQKNTHVVDSRGNLVTSIDNFSNKIFYSYSPMGSLWRAIDPLGNIVVSEYDNGGRKTRMVDPDLGDWSYQYDGFGQQIAQISATSKTITKKYDLLGRLIARNAEDLNSDWQFDNCVNGIGRVCKISADNGFSQNFTYDGLGRVSSTTATIDAPYNFTMTYDVNGRIATMSYPAGLVVRYSYTKLGYLKDIRDNSSNQLYWQADALDASGNITAQTFGNGIVTYQNFLPESGRIKSIFTTGGVSDLGFTFDALGNLTTRESRNDNISESFLYDGLARLQSSTMNAASAGIYNQKTEYSETGNIIKRSGVGTYVYGSINDRPHAVQNIALESGGSRKFEYDANGSVIRETLFDSSGGINPAGKRRMVYTSFGMPLKISHGVSETMSFLYGPNYQRVKKTDSSGTTIYIHPDGQGGMLYEKEIRTSGVVEHRQFITANGVVVAVVKTTGSATRTEYFHRDHLQSIIAITDSSGRVVERLAYEPFGKRRSVGGGLDTNNSISGSATTRGFTGHEHLDPLGLIHMNGRVYDPFVGRFLSADPTVPEISDLQSFNRYSYTRNNPLSMVDPSGYNDSRLDAEYKLDAMQLLKDEIRGLGDYAKDLVQQKIEVLGQKLDRQFSDGVFTKPENIQYLMSNSTASQGGSMGVGSRSVIPPGPCAPPFCHIVPGSRSNQLPPISGKVQVLIWHRMLNKKQVGHVMVVDHGTKRVLVSQFPFNKQGTEGTFVRRPRGFNRKLEYQETLDQEGRAPDAIFSVELSDYLYALNQASEEISREYWDANPVDACETQCTTAAFNVLSAGGLDLTFTNHRGGVIMPNTMSNWLKNLSNKPNSGVVKER